MNNCNVVYQCFDKNRTLLNFPYPPVYMDTDTDYICFSMDKNIVSKYWTMLYVDNYDNDVINSILDKYNNKKMIFTNQVQTAPLFESSFDVYERLVTIPDFSELPDVKFEPSQFVPTKAKDGSYIYQENPVITGGPYEGRPLLLTIGVPVSNQIDTVDRCLSHIRPLLDELDSELVVIDTGSTDGTLDVCRKYNARIIEFPWCNNMSAARNTAIYNAHGLWYMSIDDDEWFEDVDAILDFFKSGDYLLYEGATYLQRNYVSVIHNAYSDVPALRLAKITPMLHFEGRIHDGLVINSNESIIGASLQSYANHHGFCRDDINKVIAKTKRNLNSLIYDLYEYPTKIRYNYQLANELSVIAHFKESEAYFFRGLSLELELGVTFCSNQHVSGLISAAHLQNSKAALYFAELFEHKYNFTLADKAYINYVKAEISLFENYPAKTVLKYYEEYLHYRRLFDEDPTDSLANTYTGLAYSNNESNINASHVLAFCAYMELGKEGLAFDELNIIKDTMIFGSEHPVYKMIHLGTGKAFVKRMDKLTQQQKEERIELFLNGFIKYTIEHDLKQCELEKFANVLAYCNMDVVMNFLAQQGSTIENVFWDKLGTPYNIDILKNCDCLQLRYVYTYLLKRKYANAVSKEASLDAFLKYTTALAKIAQLYYNPRLFKNVLDCSIPTEFRVAYLVWRGCNGTNLGQMINDLKGALSLCPEMHSEIGQLLKILSI